MTVDFQDIIAVGLAAVAALYAGRLMWRVLNGKTGCASNCGCGDKPPDAGETATVGRRGLKRRPLVTLNQVGKSTPMGQRDSTAAP